MLIYRLSIDVGYCLLGHLGMLGNKHMYLKNITLKMAALIATAANYHRGMNLYKSY